MRMIADFSPGVGGISSISQGYNGGCENGNDVCFAVVLQVWTLKKQPKTPAANMQNDTA
jgi:hypothetical protein